MVDAFDPMVLVQLVKCVSQCELNLLRCCVPGCDVDFYCRVGYRDGCCRGFGYRDGDCDVDYHDGSDPSFLVDFLGFDNCHDHHAVPKMIK